MTPMLTLRRRIFLLALAAAFVLGATPALAQPSFDCSKASGSVEELICSDEGLAALDRRLAEVWPQALANFPEEDQSMARAYQRGWIKGRDECWKADDVRQCVEQEYGRRITELEIRGGLVVVPSPVALRCESGTPLTATYYTNTQLAAAVVTYGDDQVVAFAAPAGSGTLYQGRNVELREHQGAVHLTWNGETTTCQPIEGVAAHGSACDGAPADASFVIATRPPAGARVSAPFEVAGCSRTFESTVTWRLLARDGSPVAEGVTSGGGVDGPGPFHFTVEVAGGTSGLHHLEVDEPRVSDEGFPPGRTVLPLVVE